ncbi:MAG: hypothetical protein ABJJ05_01480 [Maribacter litoralis]|uniref:hypothetical protein n=1 Tax=Maribacter litoralis TaxID=2059726 RepID=UPI0032998AEF
MENINYIKHLNGVFLLFSKDGRLNPTHISIYVALFQFWNNYHFPKDFYVNRDEVMQFAKIGSKTTYHRCIKELHHWKYIVYDPSHNPFHGSKIKMFNFGTSDGQVLYPNPTNNGTSNGQAVVSINKPLQTIKNNANETKLDQPKNQNEVIGFFEKEHWPAIEAKKFFNHYQGIGWRIGGKTKIVDWKATARNWMLKAKELKAVKTEVEVSQQTDNLKTSTHKNYHEPL